MNNNTFLMAVLCFTMCISSNLKAQQYETAIALPAQNITIDGQLSDWPAKFKKYPISNIGFGEFEGSDDCNANFKIAFNQERQSVYIGVEVLDSDIIMNEDIYQGDYLYLYLDPVHSPSGGSMTLVEVGGTLKNIIDPQPSSFSPYAPTLTWDDINVAYSRNGNTISYEWEINIGSYLHPDMIMGLDIIVADIDNKGEEEAWKTWKNGTGKSQGSQRLGEVILIDDLAKLRRLEGNITHNDQHIRSVESLRIKSTTNPNIWLTTEVDSMGSYQCVLPKGKYMIQPEHQLSSHIYSGDFKQDSRKITVDKPVFLELKDQAITIADTMEIYTVPLQEGLFEVKGILMQDEFSEYKVDRFVKTVQDYFSIPGVSIALIKNGNVVYDKVFGVRSALTNEALRKNDLFEGASITKSVFAIMALKLSEDGKLDLDKPLYQYLRFPNIEHDERYKTITARHILNHQSGLDNWPIGSYSGQLSDAKAELGFAPGSDFKYSGEAFNYLGRVIEKITNKSLSKIFKDDLAPAFGMVDSYFAFDSSFEENCAMGHYNTYPRYKDKYPNIDSPASSIHTSATDFSQFLIGLMNKVYLTPASYELITQVHQLIKKGQRLYSDEWHQGIGHGFFVTNTPDGKVIGHGGNNLDFECKYGLLMDNKTGYAIFANSNVGDEFIRLLELYLLHGADAYELEFNKSGK